MQNNEKTLKTVALMIITSLCTIIIFAIILITKKVQSTDISKLTSQASTTLIGSDSYVTSSDHNNEILANKKYDITFQSAREAVGDGGNGYVDVTVPSGVTTVYSVMWYNNNISTNGTIQVSGNCNASKIKSSGDTYYSIDLWKVENITNNTFRVSHVNGQSNGGFLVWIFY